MAAVWQNTAFICRLFAFDLSCLCVFGLAGRKVCSCFSHFRPSAAPYENFSCLSLAGRKGEYTKIRQSTFLVFFFAFSLRITWTRKFKFFYVLPFRPAVRKQRLSYFRVVGRQGDIAKHENIPKSTFCPAWRKRRQIEGENRTSKMCRFLQHICRVAPWCFSPRQSKRLKHDKLPLCRLFVLHLAPRQAKTLHGKNQPS